MSENTNCAKNEDFADRFARELLMPEKEFAARVFAGYSVVRLAATFAVFPERVIERIDELGLREFVGLPPDAYEPRKPTSWRRKRRWAKKHLASKR